VLGGAGLIAGLTVGAIHYLDTERSAAGLPGSAALAGLVGTGVGLVIRLGLEMVWGLDTGAPLATRMGMALEMIVGSVDTVAMLTLANAAVAGGNGGCCRRATGSTGPDRRPLPVRSTRRSTASKSSTPMAGSTRTSSSARWNA